MYTNAIILQAWHGLVHDGLLTSGHHHRMDPRIYTCYYGTHVVQVSMLAYLYKRPDQDDSTITAL